MTMIQATVAPAAQGEAAKTTPKTAGDAAQFSAELDTAQAELADAIATVPGEAVAADSAAPAAPASAPAAAESTPAPAVPEVPALVALVPVALPETPTVILPPIAEQTVSTVAENPAEITPAVAAALVEIDQDEPADPEADAQPVDHAAEPAALVVALPPTTAPVFAPAPVVTQNVPTEAAAPASVALEAPRPLTGSAPTIVPTAVPTDAPTAGHADVDRDAPAAPVPATAVTPSPTPVATTDAVAPADVAQVTPPAVAAPSAPRSAAEVAAPAAAARAAAPDLAAQLSSPLRGLRTAGDGTHSMTISVTPDNLGPVQVRAHVSGENVRIELIAPTDQAREALKAILPDLRRDLSSGGGQATLDLSSGNQPSGRENPASDQDGRRLSEPTPAPRLTESLRPVRVNSGLDVFA